MAFRVDSSRGEGNYRLTVSRSNDEFIDDRGDKEDDALLGATLSFNQQLGQICGGFLRVGWPDDDADTQVWILGLRAKAEF